MASNTPRGNTRDELSSYHKGHPVPILLHRYFTSDKVHPKLEDMVKKMGELRILDVGCGMGSTFCELLVSYGDSQENIFYADIDLRNLTQSDERRNKVVADAAALPFDSSKFDVVFSNEMTLDNRNLPYRKVLREVARILKSGGIYVANEHFDYLHEQRLSDSIIEMTTRDLHPLINNAKALRRVGFKPVAKIKYFDCEKAHKDMFKLYLFEKI